MKQYFAFQWHITDDCDQRCKHCYIFAENNCKQLDSMPWTQMQAVIDNCEDFCEMDDQPPYFISPAATRFFTRTSGRCWSCWPSSEFPSPS